MKKILALVLCVGVLFSFTACTKSEIALHPDVASVRDDTATYRPPHHYIDFDNEISAKDLKVAKKKEMTGDLWAIGDIGSAGYTSSQWISLSDGQLRLGKFYDTDYFCLRYNYGRYYAVMKVNDGSYFFVLFNEHDLTSGELSGIDSCFIKRLAKAEKAEEISLGDPVRRVRWKLSNRWHRSAGYALLEKEVYTVRYDDLTTRRYSFEEGKLTQVVTALPENSVLTYLLPQDLALIS